MKPATRVSFWISVSALWFFGPIHVDAAESTGWRGAARDGRVGDFSIPTPWPKDLKLGWKLEVGEGHSSPILRSSATVYIFSREGDEEALRALEIASGKLLWRTAYAAPYKVNPEAALHGAGPKSTPLLVETGAGARIVTLGIGGILSCFDAESGKTHWTKVSSGEFPTTAPLYGTAMSPLEAGGLCVVHVGGHDKGSLRAFDLATGEIRWSLNGDGPAYASPVLAQLGGVRQVITQTQSRLVGVSLETGKLLWALPFVTEYDQNAVTPLIVKDTLVYSGYGQPLAAVRVQPGDPSWKVEQVWSNSDMSLYMSSPIAHEGRIYGVSSRQKGQLFCVDALTGKTLWRGAGRLGENASLLDLGSVFSVLTTDGDLLFVSPDAHKEEVVAKYKVGAAPVWAHPLVVGSRIVVKDKTTLYGYSLQ